MRLKRPETQWHFILALLVALVLVVSAYFASTYLARADFGSDRSADEREQENKFGRSTNVDDGILTDIWDGANPTDDQDIWLAPTSSRFHLISSDSISDVAGGIGATTVEIYYLPDWDTLETNETVSGNLDAGITMTNAAAIIHRMFVIPQSTSTTPNDGTITALAIGDGTVTAQINPGEGQTQMAIYGIPSSQRIEVLSFHASVLRSSPPPTERFVNISLVFCPNPALNPIVCLVKHTAGLGSRGQNPFQHIYPEGKRFDGPGIVKLEAVGFDDDLDVSGGFDFRKFLK